MNEQQLQAIPELASLLQEADHVDIKVVTGETTLREFIAGMFNYYPRWMKGLYRIRWGFVRLLGMKQEGIPQQIRMHPEDVPMGIGEQASFFKVACATEEQYWVAGTAEAHLSAYLGVVVESGVSTNRFHLLTIVHYHNWTGRIYFNVIRPFHHLVVRKMAQAGVAAVPMLPM